MPSYGAGHPYTKVGRVLIGQRVLGGCRGAVASVVRLKAFSGSGAQYFLLTLKDLGFRALIFRD